MPFIDDRGRLFGRLNIIDAAVLLVVAVLIPMAYAAYLVFRPPPARIVALEPAQVTEGTTDVTLRGEHLRPYLRVMVGKQSATFLFANVDGGVLRLPELAPGAYDVVLFDEETELMRVQGGLVVDAKPPTAPPYIDVVLRSVLWPEEVALLASWNRDGTKDGHTLVSFDVVGKQPGGQLSVVVRMRLPASETERGWHYGEQLIRIGERLVIQRQPSHQLSGRVVGIAGIDPDSTKAASLHP